MTNTVLGLPAIPMMIAFAAVVGICLLVLVVLGAVKFVLVKLSLRNIPRRRAQTSLIILGLMLATLIITASLSIGDTISHDIRTQALSSLGNLDETVEKSFLHGESAVPYMTPSDQSTLLAMILADKDVQAALPIIGEDTSMTDLTSRQIHGQSIIVGIQPQDADKAGITGFTSNQGISLADLKPGEVLATSEMAKQLNVHAGDKVRIFVNNRVVDLTVRDVINYDYLGEVVGIMNLSDLQNLEGRPGMVNEIFIVNKGKAVQEHIAVSDSIVTNLRSSLANKSDADQLEQLLSTSNIKDLLTQQETKALSGSPQQQKIADLLKETGKSGATPQFIKLVQDPILQSALDTIAPKFTQDQQTKYFSLTEGLSPYVVTADKADAIDAANQAAAAISGIFLVISLFSIIVGLLLIFLIFVMLAAERKPEMGMARALGIKRRNLIEIFTFEGVAYSIGAALVGVLLGVGVGYGMVGIVAQIIASVTDSFKISYYIEPSSLVIAFCLGLLITFIVVLISSYKVSVLNIVAAIRDLPDEVQNEDKLWRILVSPFVTVFTGLRLLSKGYFLDFLYSITFGPFFNLLSILWALTKRGILPLIAGFLLVKVGLSTGSRSSYSTGVSLLLIGAGFFIHWILRSLKLRFADRAGYTLTGALLLFYWGNPVESAEKLLGIDKALGLDKMNTDQFLFFVSGIMLVAGAIWLIMYNSDLVIEALVWLMNLSRRMAPVARTSLAYPLQAKFRTGMLLAMFSLVMFTVIFMSVVISADSSVASDTTKLSGGWLIYANANHASSQIDIPSLVQNDPKLTSEIQATSQVAGLRTPAHQVGKNDLPWSGTRVDVADNTFFDNTGFSFSAKAKGYDHLSDADIWHDVKSQSGLAVIDNQELVQNGVGGGIIEGINPADKTFQPVKIELRDAQNEIRTVTVIGLIDTTGNFLPDYNGLFISQQTARNVLPGIDLQPTSYFFKTKPGVSINQARLDLGSAFLNIGIEPFSFQDQLGQFFSVGLNIDRLLQGFLGLGLFVGIAGLGVISTRAVVERRQQIGMLRAIGFSRGLINFSFLFESSFIAVLGIIIGAVLGILSAHNFLRDYNSGPLQFSIPWLQVTLILVGSYLATLLTTYLPARAAARVYPAEALRYE